MLSNSGVPIELVDGFIESISVLVPWKALLNDSCEIEIHGLSLTFAGKQKSEGIYMLFFPCNILFVFPCKIIVNAIKILNQRLKI